jgi:hypothetical protein
VAAPLGVLFDKPILASELTKANEMRIGRAAVTNVLAKLLILATSLVFSILAAELVARAVLDPIDYLNPTLVRDEFLGPRIEGHTGGHDAWGFRNARRPETADIVCIGDSETYGVSVPARESWPMILARLSSKTVYNMGMGGYGPIQYLYLLQNLAVKLRPKTVIVGISLQTDLFDVYYTVRSNKHWSKYKNVETAKLEQGGALIWPRGPGKFLGGLRDWLSKNSMLYVLVTQLSIFDFIRDRELTAQGASESDLIRYRDERHQETFNLAIRFLNLRDPRIQNAMQMTGHIMSDMQSVAEKRGMRLIMALIPTKERVYSKLVQQAGYREKYPRLADALDQEDEARVWMINLLRQLGIETVDLLPALEAAVSDRDLYPPADPHPNKYGTRVIAQAIDDYLEIHPPSDSVVAQDKTERAGN